MITSTEFKSNLTGKQYHTKCLEHLDCSTTNVVYGIECSLCGLVYVGETQNSLRSRMNGHRNGVNTSLNLVLYNHFNQADHSILSMRVRILEKIYHHTNSPKLSSPFRKQHEDFWIKELGSAMPYGCNDHIFEKGNLSSPGCSDVNVMSLFNRPDRKKRSHGHRHYHRPKSVICSSTIPNSETFDNLLSYMQKPLGLHHIRTSLFSFPLHNLRDFKEYALNRPYLYANTIEYRLISIIADISIYRLFRPVQSRPLLKEHRHFMHLNFANKGIDALNISNVLHHKRVTSNIPSYFENQSVPIVSYSYTKTIASNIFNYKKALQNFSVDNFIRNPTPCDCSSSVFNYSPLGHVITGDLNIIKCDNLRKIVSHGPKFREPKHINWGHNFKIIMDSVEDYAKKWAKREKAEEDSLSEWIKSIRSLILGRIHKLKSCVNHRPKSVFKDPDAHECMSSLHEKYVVVPADKASNNIVFICKSYYYMCLIKELGLGEITGNPTYRQSTFDRDEIIANHASFMTSLNIPTKDDNNDLPNLYWIPKLQ